MIWPIAEQAEPATEEGTIPLGATNVATAPPEVAAP